jgi:hypothetical protein
MPRGTTVIAFRQPEAIDDPLSEVAREGARRMLAQVLIAEADSFVAYMSVRSPRGIGPGRYVPYDDKREAAAFRALCGLLLRFQLTQIKEGRPCAWQPVFPPTLAPPERGAFFVRAGRNHLARLRVVRQACA